MSIKHDNIILYIPEGDDLHEVMDALDDGPHDHLVRNGAAIVYNMSQYFYHQPHDGSDGQWRAYSDELAETGTWVFNDASYGYGWADFAKHMMKKFTIKELMTQTIIIELDW